MRICDKDCENCVYDDCINDEMDAEDILEAEKRDRLCRSPESVQKRARRYYMKNHKKCLAQSKKYYQEHREKLSQYQRKYYAANRDRINAMKRMQTKRNRGRYGQKQRALRIERIMLGMTQKEVARALGVSISAVSHWERGITPCNVEAVIRKLREAVRGLGCGREDSSLRSE